MRRRRRAAVAPDAAHRRQALELGDGGKRVRGCAAVCYLCRYSGLLGLRLDASKAIYIFRPVRKLYPFADFSVRFARWFRFASGKDSVNMPNTLHGYR